jgi:alanyl-tRNA synthetase
MKQGDLVEHKSIVTKVGMSELNKKRYQWIQLNETIFHPKGGGQPSDEGTINGINVVYVHKEIFDKSRLDQFEILHCFDENQQLNFKEGDEVELKVDSSKRKLHSRLHTAGHIVAEAVRKNFPELEGYQGNHYPNDSYVKFRMLEPTKSYEKEDIKNKASMDIQSWIEKDLSISDGVLETGIRSIKITQDWSACGGTHLTSLRDIGSVEIWDVSINKKDGTVTVKYRIT